MTNSLFFSDAQREAMIAAMKQTPSYQAYLRRKEAGIEYLRNLYPDVAEPHLGLVWKAHMEDEPCRTCKGWPCPKKTGRGYKIAIVETRPWPAGWPFVKRGACKFNPSRNAINRELAKVDEQIDRDLQAGLCDDGKDHGGGDGERAQL